MEKRKRALVKVLALILAFIGGLLVGSTSFPRQVISILQPQPIYPSIYITGSSGKIDSIDPMVAAMVGDPATKAQRGLEIIIKKDGSLAVSGLIDSRNNHYPTIEVGMEEGTNNSLKYESALKSVMSYLGKHYNIPYANVLGYSAGGAGVFRYLIEYGYDRSLPQVKKWVSLDGQFNASTAQPEQSLDQVLAQGPQNQTKFYLYWEANYQKLDAGIQVALLAGNYDSAKQSDGVVPWADAFSIYPLLIKNHNPVEHYIFTGQNTEHSLVAKNQQAIKYVKVFFYE